MLAWLRVHGQLYALLVRNRPLTVAVASAGAHQLLAVGAQVAVDTAGSA